MAKACGGETGCVLLMSRPCVTPCEMFKNPGAGFGGVIGAAATRLEIALSSALPTTLRGAGAVVCSSGPALASAGRGRSDLTFIGAALVATTGSSSSAGSAGADFAEGLGLAGPGEL